MNTHISSELKLFLEDTCDPLLLKLPVLTRLIIVEMKMLLKKKK